jgi:hypothetical protein
MSATTLTRTETQNGRQVNTRPKPKSKFTTKKVAHKSKNKTPITYVVASLLLVLTLAYIAVYANFRMEGYTRSALIEQRRQEKLQNERLRVKLSVLNAPDVLVDKVVKSGMVCATQYMYLTETRQVSR